MSLTQKTRRTLALSGVIVAVPVGFLAFSLQAVSGAPPKQTTVSVTAGKPSEFRFTLARKSIPTGTVVFKLTNRGNLPHDLEICASNKGGNANSCKGKVSKLISPGQSTSLTYTFKQKGTYEYLCTVPGHAAAGMKGDLKAT